MRTSLFAAALAFATAMPAMAVGPCSCVTDLNVDGVTDAADLAILLGAWGGSGDGDFDGDGDINAPDLAILLGAWGPCAPPSNDECNNAILVTGETALVPFCTAAATTSTPGFPTCDGISAPIGKDVWYRYVAPYSGKLILDTCEANFDTMLAVYGSTIPGLCACPSNGVNFATLRACNDDGPACGLGSFVEFDMNEGECFSIRLGGYIYSGNPDEGYGELLVRPIKEGDRCDIAHELGSAFSLSVPGTNAGDTWIQADPSSCATQDTRDEWYRFTVPCDATVDISTCDPGTDYDTTLSVFADCTGGNEIACNDDSSIPGCQLAGLNRKSLVTINALGGEVLYIRVSGFNGATGNFVLTISVDCNG